METEGYYKDLEEKYWSGETNLIEDSAIDQAVKDRPELFSDQLIAVFKARAASSELKLGDDFDNEFWNRVDQSPRSSGFSVFHFMRYAAAGILLVGMAYVFTKVIQNPEPDQNTDVAKVQTVEDTYDSPEVAFEEAKKALMMASGKLNKGQEKIEEIKRFHHAKVTVMGAAEKE